LRSESLQTIECVQIAEKLRRQTFAIDDRFGDARTCRVLRET
jgi:hypothetical protein